MELASIANPDLAVSALVAVVFHTESTVSAILVDTIESATNFDKLSMGAAVVSNFLSDSLDLLWSDLWIDLSCCLDSLGLLLNELLFVPKIAFASWILVNVRHGAYVTEAMATNAGHMVATVNSFNDSTTSSASFPSLLLCKVKKNFISCTFLQTRLTWVSKTLAKSAISCLTDLALDLSFIVVVKRNKGRASRVLAIHFLNTLHLNSFLVELEKVRPLENLLGQSKINSLSAALQRPKGIIFRGLKEIDFEALTARPGVFTEEEHLALLLFKQASIAAPLFGLVEVLFGRSSTGGGRIGPSVGVDLNVIDIIDTNLRLCFGFLLSFIDVE